jgi:hypothetical protein
MPVVPNAAPPVSVPLCPFPEVSLATVPVVWSNG